MNSDKLLRKFISSVMLLLLSSVKIVRQIKALKTAHIQSTKHKVAQWRCYSNTMSIEEKSSQSQPCLSLAPMMDYTDRHYRHMVRLLSRNTILYTEMVAANAIVHRHNLGLEGDEDAHLRVKRFVAQSKASPLEEPCVLQLGGADRELLYHAVRIVHSEYSPDTCNYSALNLNCGCPSSKVASSGAFGAALMHDPILVRDITRSMSEGCNHELPITVKCRIGTDMTNPNWKNPSGVDDSKLYSQLHNFIETIASDSIVTDFQIHARMAILNKNFSPLDNRQIPPLRYDIVSRLIQDFPELKFTINGGIETLAQAENHLKTQEGLDGVMIGRGFLSNPWQFAMTDYLLHDQNNLNTLTRYELLQAYGKHADMEESSWGIERTRRMILKPLQSLFHAEKNNKKFKQKLDQLAVASSSKRMNTNKSDSNEDGELLPLSQLILNAASDSLSEEVLFRTAEQSYYRNIE